MLFLIQSLEGYSAIEILAVCLGFFLAVCIALTFHEWAQAFTAYKCGDDTAKLAGRLTLNPLAHMSPWGLLCFAFIGFGWGKPVPLNPAKFRSYRKHSVLVILSGVLANFLLAFIFAGLYLFLGGLCLVEWVASGSVLCLFVERLLFFALELNIILMLFNLLPIPPLAGFNLISLLTRYGNKFVEFMLRYGFIVLLVLILPIFGGYSALSYFYAYALPLFESYFIFFWGLFL